MLVIFYVQKLFPVTFKKNMKIEIKTILPRGLSCEIRVSLNVFYVYFVCKMIRHYLNIRKRKWDICNDEEFRDFKDL